jgi:hypothetical protein
MWGKLTKWRRSFGAPIAASMAGFHFQRNRGRRRLAAALDLLRENSVSDAVRMLQAVAEDKTAHIQQDSKDGADAYRNLGAIAGLGDPRQAKHRVSARIAAADIEWSQKSRQSLRGCDRGGRGDPAVSVIPPAFRPCAARRSGWRERVKHRAPAGALPST